MGLDQLMRLFRAAFISEIVKVDGQQRRSLANKGFPMIGRVGLKNFRSDDVLPTMILKIVHCHEYLLT
jgi:hypothetical protein